MKKRDNYLARYYERATLDQLEAEYRGKGYAVRRDVRLSGYRIDMLAEKDGQQVYIEVTSGRMDGTARRRIEALENTIRQLPHARFIVIPGRYSEDKEIEFDGLEGIIMQFFVEDFPDELDELSTHTRLEAVDSVAVDVIRIYGQDIVLKCSGQVTVSLQYGSDGEQEDGPTPTMSFPFEMEGTISWKDDGYEVTEVDSLRIDTGEYYR